MSINQPNKTPHQHSTDFNKTDMHNDGDATTINKQGHIDHLGLLNKTPTASADTVNAGFDAKLTGSNQQGHMGHLELLEERSVVNKERLDVGKVIVTKHSRTKTIQVPIELVEEYITIQTDYNDAQSQDLLSGQYDDKDILRHVEPSLDSKAVVTVNDKQIEIGDAPIEIVLSRQVATITKETHVIQDVNIRKSTHMHIDTIEVELKHEELDVTEEGVLAHDSVPTAKK